MLLQLLLSNYTSWSSFLKETISCIQINHDYCLKLCRQRVGSHIMASFLLALHSIINQLKIPLKILTTNWIFGIFHIDFSRLQTNEKKSLSSKSIQIHLKQEYSCAVCASAEQPKNPYFKKTIELLQAYLVCIDQTEQTFNKRMSEWEQYWLLHK